VLRQLRLVLDTWRFWALVSWVLLAGIVVWLVVLGGRLDANVKETKKATVANRNAIAFLCNTNAILQALTEQAAVLLQSQQLAQFSMAREITISVFRGYDDQLSDARACVRSEKAVLRP